jgi:hypothetical protein
VALRKPHHLQLETGERDANMIGIPIRAFYRRYVKLAADFARLAGYHLDQVITYDVKKVVLYCRILACGYWSISYSLASFLVRIARIVFR